MEKSEVAREILAYLVDHPDAQDTLEGIAHWWLLERQIKYHASLVKEVIQDLVESGLLLESQSMGTRPGYRINADKLEEILKVCRDASDSPRGRQSQDGKLNQ